VKPPNGSNVTLTNPAAQASATPQTSSHLGEAPYHRSCTVFFSRVPIFSPASVSWWDKKTESIQLDPQLSRTSLSRHPNFIPSTRHTKCHCDLFAQAPVQKVSRLQRKSIFGHVHPNQSPHDLSNSATQQSISSHIASRQQQNRPKCSSTTSTPQGETYR